jgi:hypothetical protein
MFRHRFSLCSFPLSCRFLLPSCPPDPSLPTVAILPAVLSRCPTSLFCVSLLPVCLAVLFRRLLSPFSPCLGVLARLGSPCRFFCSSVSPLFGLPLLPSCLAFYFLYLLLSSLAVCLAISLAVFLVVLPRLPESTSSLAVLSRRYSRRSVGWSTIDASPSCLGVRSRRFVVLSCRSVSPSCFAVFTRRHLSPSCSPSCLGVPARRLSRRPLSPSCLDVFFRRACCDLPRMFWPFFPHKCFASVLPSSLAVLSRFPIFGILPLSFSRRLFHNLFRRFLPPFCLAFLSRHRPSPLFIAAILE